WLECLCDSLAPLENEGIRWVWCVYPGDTTLGQELFHERISPPAPNRDIFEMLLDHDGRNFPLHPERVERLSGRAVEFCESLFEGTRDAFAGLPGASPISDEKTSLLLGEGLSRNPLRDLASSFKTAVCRLDGAPPVYAAIKQICSKAFNSTTNHVKPVP